MVGTEGAERGVSYKASQSRVYPLYQPLAADTTHPSRRGQNATRHNYPGQFRSVYIKQLALHGHASGRTRILFQAGINSLKDADRP